MSEWFEGISPAMHAGWLPAARSAFNLVLILAGTWAALTVVNRGIRRFRHYMEARTRDNEEAKRAGTLCRAFRYFGSVVISIVAAMLVMNELGISIAPILATAGVAGIAIGFGAQSLVKDYFAGFFLLLEDQIRQSDVVTIAGIGGQVEEVTLRYVKLRDFEGHVHFVPNGEIKIVTNKTRDYAHSLVQVGIAYRENIDAALDVLRDIGRAMRSDANWRARILDDLEIVGVERLADSAVVLSCRLKVVGIEQWNVRREFLRRLKMAFDERGIEIPYPQLTLYARRARESSAQAPRPAGAIANG